MGSILLYLGEVAGADLSRLATCNIRGLDVTYDCDKFIQHVETGV